MTNDYKNLLLKYITGNLEVETGINEPQFSTTQNKSNNLETYFDTAFPYGYFIYNQLQGKNASGDGEGFTIIYGIYYTDASATTLKGFILLLDTDFDVVQLFKEYDTGTDFNLIENISVDDDGNFMMIEKSGTTVYLRLLNNFTQKLPTETNYSIYLKKSYILPTNIKSCDAFNKIIKDPNRRNYLISGDYNTGQPIASELKIADDNSTSWTEYTYGSSTTFFTIDTYAEWNSTGTIDFKLLGISGTTSITYTEFSKSGSALARQTFGSAISGSLGLNILSLAKEENYFNIIVSDGTYERSYLYKVNYSTNGLDQIFYNNGIRTDAYESYTGIRTFNVNNELYFYLLDNTTSTVATNTINITLYKVIGSDYYSTTVASITDNVSLLSSLQITFGTKLYDLYTLYFQIGDIIYYTKQIYNTDDYNGLEYTDYNLLVPKNCVLYDSSNNEIFARDLFNLVNNSSTTTAIFKIPNTLLNDKTISKQKLFSETNYNLVDNTEDITKNIYEEVLINFINTILLVNNNDTDNPLYNQLGANHISDGVACGTKDCYDNSKALKYKKVYEDDTSEFYNISPDLITFVGNVATFEIYIYINGGNRVKELDIYSNDETTKYATLNMSSTENDTYYKIIQKLEVK